MSDLVVFDTNVFVSYLLPPKQRLTAVKIVVNRILDGKAVPVYSDATMEEYAQVLCRTKFHFSQTEVHALLNLVRSKGIYVETISSNIFFSDPTDKCFYEAALSSLSWLVTGNKRQLSRRTFHREPAGVHRAGGDLTAVGD